MGKFSCVVTRFVLAADWLNISMAVGDAFGNFRSAKMFCRVGNLRSMEDY